MEDHLKRQLRDLPYFRALIRSVEASYYQNLDLPEPVLDVGCGDGHFASLTFDQKIDAGIDPAFSSLQETKRRRNYKILLQAEGASIPVRGETFSSAFSNSVLEHIPDIEPVLTEINRTLQPGAPFYFCVPNERYLSELSISKIFGKGYTEWFRRISRVEHADGPDIWEARLQRTGFLLEKWWHYFSPSAMRVLEWGHYFGLPSWIIRKTTGRWILVPENWNLRFLERIIRPYASPEAINSGVFTFYIARKRN